MEVFWSFGPRLVLRGKGELVVLCDDGRCVDGIYVGAFCAAEAFLFISNCTPLSSLLLEHHSRRHEP
jgi:hypothetical protein